MATYYFDQWAEYLAVTLTSNIASCDLSHQEIEKLRLNIHPKTYWPTRFKAISHNHLVASNQNSNHQNGSSDVQFLYRNPCFIPADENTKDPVASQFLKSVSKWQPDFYEDAWNLNKQGSIPGLLRQLALRSFVTVMENQLRHEGIELHQNFEIQFFDGENYKTWHYDTLVNELKRSLSLYLTHEKSRKLAADLCFKHKTNKDWFLAL